MGVVRMTVQDFADPIQLAGLRGADHLVQGLAGHFGQMVTGHDFGGRIQKVATAARVHHENAGRGIVGNRLRQPMGLGERFLRLAAFVDFSLQLPLYGPGLLEVGFSPTPCDVQRFAEPTDQEPFAEKDQHAHLDVEGAP